MEPCVCRSLIQNFSLDMDMSFKWWNYAVFHLSESLNIRQHIITTISPQWQTKWNSKDLSKQIEIEMEIEID